MISASSSKHASDGLGGVTDCDYVHVPDGLRDVTLWIVVNCDSVQLWVKIEVLGHHLQGHFH